MSWIPTAQAARALLQMRNSQEGILHLCHPSPVPWKTFLEPISNDLHVPLVPYKVWLDALEACLPDHRYPDATDMQKYPALRLLNFFRDVEIHADKEPLGVARLDVQKAIIAAPALRTDPLTSAWAERWLRAWRACGHISQRGREGAP